MLSLPKRLIGAQRYGNMHSWIQYYSSGSDCLNIILEGNNLLWGLPKFDKEISRDLLNHAWNHVVWLKESVCCTLHRQRTPASYRFVLTGNRCRYVITENLGTLYFAERNNWSYSLLVMRRFVFSPKKSPEISSFLILLRSSLPLPNFTRNRARKPKFLPLGLHHIGDHSKDSGAADFSSAVCFRKQPTLFSVFSNWRYFKYCAAEIICIYA